MYVSLSASGEAVSGQVVIFDVESNQQIGVIEGGGPNSSDPEGLAITPDGRFLYVGNLDGGISIIDTASHLTVGLIFGLSAGGVEQRLKMTDDGKFLYVTGFKIVQVVDLSLNRIVANIPIPGNAFPANIVFGG